MVTGRSVGPPGPRRDRVRPAGYGARIGPRSLLRIPVFVAAVLTIVVTLVARLQWVTWPAELFTNFPVQLFFAAVLVLAVAALARAPVSAALAAIAMLLSGLMVLGTLTTEPHPVRPNGERVTVGHLNAQSRAIDTVALARYLTQTRPDVFVVLDPLQQDVRALRVQVPGFTVQTTGSRIDQLSNYVRAIVIGRLPVDGVQHPTDESFGPTAVEMTIRAPDGPIDAVVLGTDSPTTPGRAHNRDRALHAAARWSRAHGPRRIVEGDFNATPWSPVFHRLLHDGGLTSSLDGYGLQVSWPESNWLLRIPIDHALLGPALATTDRGTGPSFGSQHRSLHLTVAPAG
jgi:endonuclease/exonuclease/phosphatase (EEP) superfamily protein YafD